MLPGMAAPLSPAAENLIRRVYCFAMALQASQIDTAAIRASMLITMEEAFLLLDCARGGPWQMAVWAPNHSGATARSERFDLDVQPQPGMAWARLFGVTLIIDADVSSRTTP
jgi:hypothetical protein